MGSLDRRIKNLEAALGGDECPVCGHDPRAPITKYEVVWDDIDAENPDERGEPEFCDGCGRQLTYIVTWDDLPPEPPKREERERGE